MSRAPAASTSNIAPSGWADCAIPWLMSASMHCVLLILLGLCAAQGAFSGSVSGTGRDLSGTVFTSQADSDYFDDDSPSAGTFDGDVRDGSQSDFLPSSGQSDARSSRRRGSGLRRRPQHRRWRTAGQRAGWKTADRLWRASHRPLRCWAARRWKEAAWAPPRRPPAALRDPRICKAATPAPASSASRDRDTSSSTFSTARAAWGVTASTPLAAAQAS